MTAKLKEMGTQTNKLKSDATTIHSTMTHAVTAMNKVKGWFGGRRLSRDHHLTGINDIFSSFEKAKEGSDTLRRVSEQVGGLLGQVNGKLGSVNTILKQVRKFTS